MDVLKKLTLPLLIAAALTAGCGESPDEAAEGEAPATQVAAKVNDTELTVHQVNHALQRIPNLTQEQSKAASLQVVRSLVDQELLVQKATEEKLHRDPEVVQSIDAARRQILAEAYMSRQLGTPVEPADTEISAYFNAHPYLFTQRKLYRLQEISIKVPEDKRDAVRARLAESGTLAEFGEWLRAENIPAQGAQGVKSAEQLPLEVLPRLAQMPKGQAMVVNTPDGLLVIVVADSQLQPVNLEQARPAISRLLQQQARQKAAEAKLESLRAAAKIEYVGDFVDAGKVAAAPAAAAPAAAAPAAAAPAAAPAAGTDADAINRGLSGL